MKVNILYFNNDIETISNVENISTYHSRCFEYTAVDVYSIIDSDVKKTRFVMNDKKRIKSITIINEWE